MLLLGKSSPTGRGEARRSLPCANLARCFKREQNPVPNLFAFRNAALPRFFAKTNFRPDGPTVSRHHRRLFSRRDSAHLSDPSQRSARTRFCRKARTSLGAHYPFVRAPSAASSLRTWSITLSRFLDRMKRIGIPA